MESYQEIELQECPICGGAGLMEEENGWCLRGLPRLRLAHGGDPL